MPFPWWCAPASPPAYICSPLIYPPDAGAGARLWPPAPHPQGHCAPPRTYVLARARSGCGCSCAQANPPAAHPAGCEAQAMKLLRHGMPMLRSSLPMLQRQAAEQVVPRISGWQLTKLRKRVLVRDAFTCQCPWCQGSDSPLRLTWATFEVDHIIPLHQGGTNELTNLRALHRTCHKRITAEQAQARFWGNGTKPHGHTNERAWGPLCPLGDALPRPTRARRPCLQPGGGTAAVGRAVALSATTATRIRALATHSRFFVPRAREGRLRRSRIVLQDRAALRADHR